MNKPKIDNIDTRTNPQLNGRNCKGLEISWSPARVQEVQIQKPVVRNRLLKALGLAVSMSAAVMVCGVTGCAGNRYEQSTGEHIDDRATSMRVKHALGEDPQYKYSMVEVKTFKGVTQLSGFADTRDEKKRAAELAKRTEGVREVQNNISVKE
jgi:hyperosmotically inducible periplasmic protein